MNTLRREMGALGWILRTVTFGLVAAAVYKELQLPAEKRTWHGRLFDFVPYDFRIPTPRKLMQAFWNPDSGNIFSEQPFGVGLDDQLRRAAAHAAGADRLRARRSRQGPESAAHRAPRQPEDPHPAVTARLR